LVANELVTNAAKYAFADRDAGEIVLGYRQEGVGWRLWVHDNGHGIRQEREGKSARTFGNQLVATLVSRLNAEIRYVSEQGTKVDVFCGVT
jgi:two-component sensor histidine kinase